MNILRKMTTGLFFSLLSLPVVAEVTSSPQAAEKLRFEAHIQSLNELTERRRINTFFTNEQTIQYGLQKGYVNTSRKNLTFVRRDMVVVGRIPIIAARVYDSSRKDTGDFSPGWYLTLAETISLQPDGSLVYIDDSTSNIHIVRDKSGYVLAQGEVSDISKIVGVSDDSVQIAYQTGWFKTFAKIGKKYRLTVINDQNGNKIQLHYKDNQVSTITDQNGHTVTFERDDSSRIVSATDENNRSVSYVYDKKGLLSQSTDLGQNQWQYQYFGKGLLKRVTDPEGNVAASFKYDNDGKVKQSTIRTLKHSYHYDENQTTVTDQNNNTTVFLHNDQGITTSVTSAEEQMSEITLDRNNRVTKLNHNGQLTADLAYGTNGKLQTLNRRRIDNSFEQLSYNYDTAGQLLGINQGNTVLSQSSFNAQGQPLRLVSNGIERTYSYNSHGDIISQNEGDKKRTFKYNADGLLTELTENGLKAAFAYSKIGRLASITFPDGNSHSYQYDALGFRSQTLRSDGSHLQYNYDSIGNLIGQQDADNQGDIIQTETILDENNVANQFIVDGSQALDITYSDTGNPTAIVYSGHTVNYHYDQLNRLVKVDEGNDNVLTYDYKDDESDLRIQLDDRTAKVKTANTKASRSTMGVDSLYTRRDGTSWQHVSWNENLSRIMLPSITGTIAADSHFKSSFQRRRLYNALAKSQRERRDFDKVSNSYNLPGEYSVASCQLVDCWLYGVLLFGPNEANEGDWVTFRAQPIMPSQECYPNYSFYVNGSFQGYNRSGVFDLDTAQLEADKRHRVEVDAACGYCPLYRQFAYTDINVKCAIPSTTAPPGTALVNYNPIRRSPPSNAVNTLWGQMSLESNNPNKPYEHDKLLSVDIGAYYDKK